MEKMNLREIQIATKDLLYQFDRLCTSLGIKYYLMCGTLLGAIRHGGFIPWDDDIDVGMMIDDYSALLEYFGKNDDSLMELHNLKTVANCYYNISRVCEKKHYLVFENRKYVSGLFIDVYPIEGMGGDEDTSYWDEQFRKIRKWRKGAFMSTSNSIFYGKNLTNKILNIPNVITAKTLGKNYYFDKIDNHHYFDIEHSKYVGVCWDTVRYPKEIFEDTLRVMFEDIEVTVPKEYEKYLNLEFGDWKKLPKASDRVPHHGYEAYIKD